MFLIFTSLNYLQGPTHIKRATTEKLRDVFQKYATQHIHGEQFMTSDDFVRGYLGLFSDTSYNKVNNYQGITIRSSVNILTFVWFIISQENMTPVMTFHLKLSFNFSVNFLRRTCDIIRHTHHTWWGTFG